MSFTRAQFHMREFPHVRPAAASGPANQQHRVSAANDDRGLADLSYNWRLRFEWNDLLETVAIGNTIARQRTTVAAWTRRRANQRAEFHESLIEIAGTPGREQSFRRLPEPLIHRSALRIAFL